MIEAKAPPWRDLFKGREARRLWCRHWFRNVPLDLLQWATFSLCTVLPLDFVSKFGATSARTIIPRVFPDMVSRTLTNLSLLQPEWSEEQRRETMLRHFENIGRVHAEFSVLHRIMPAGRVEILNDQMVLEAMEKSAVIFVGVHTGNWEVFGPINGRYGVPGFFVYEPQISPMQNYLLQKARLRTATPGTLTLPPGPGAVLQALRTLKGGNPISIFCDEPSADGLSRAPFFGRAPHLDSNYAVAVRLARRAKVPIVPFHCVRHANCRFTVTFEPLMNVSGYDDNKAAVLEDVVRLNDIVEPIVRSHLDQWYWLNWAAG